MHSIMPAFDKFPQEGAIIGRLLAGYGELELELCLCVAAARSDFNMVFKAMFRSHGVAQRIQIADAMGRELYQDLQLGTQFNEAISAVDHCRKIRNQFAHCYWTDDFGRQLGFIELEETAKRNKRVDNVFSSKACDIDPSHLEKLESYFVYARDCLRFLTYEAEGSAEKGAKNPLATPKKVKRPILHRP